MNPLRTDEELEDALAQADELIALDPAPDSPQGKRLMEIVEAIEAYESGLAWELGLQDERYVGRPVCSTGDKWK